MSITIYEISQKVNFDVLEQETHHAYNFRSAMMLVELMLVGL